jgi:predicted O-methyltransferase YrrM
VNRIRTYRSDKDVLTRLSNLPIPQGGQIVEVLNAFKKPLPESERNLIQQIERERSRLQEQHVPLADGSLGDVELYDKRDTISSACKVSKHAKECLLMYHLIRIFKPKTVIELGTNVGISSAYQAAALSVNGPEGRVVTLEASLYRLRLAKRLHRTIGLENVSYVQGLFSETLGQTLNDLGTIDFAFIDGHHQYQPTLDYFEAICKHAQPYALFVLDDIRWSDGMLKAWSQIQKDKRLSLAVDLNSMGICVGGQESESEAYVTPLIFSPLAQIL